MIRQWLADGSLEDFLDAHYGRSPRSGAGTASALPTLDWPMIGRLLSRRRPDLLVVRNGALWRGPLPRSLFDAHALFREGWSLVLRGVERHDEGFAKLAASLEAELGGRASVQLYLTPKGYQSFGWHYDAEHVFIAQAGGVKDYHFRENTVNPRPRVLPKDLRYELEKSPVFACKLAAGDWLYIPAGWWHAARAEADSFSVSVGLLEPAAPAPAPRPAALSEARIPVPAG